PLHRSSFLSLNHTATPQIYTLSLHDALPISHPLVEVGEDRPVADGLGEDAEELGDREAERDDLVHLAVVVVRRDAVVLPEQVLRSEEHTSELQSRGHLVCRLLLEKKKNKWAKRSPHHPAPRGQRRTSRRRRRRSSQRREGEQFATDLSR